MASEGRCISCGFLGKRARTFQDIEIPGTFEVSPSDRTDPRNAFGVTIPGAVNFYFQTGGGRGLPVPNATFQANLVCFRGAASLPDELVETASARHIERIDAAGEVLTKARDCQQWIEHVPGLDPKEHLMDRRLSELEADRRLFQRALDRGVRRLTFAGIMVALTGIIVAMIIGSAQIIASESGIRHLQAAYIGVYCAVSPSKCPKPAQSQNEPPL